MIDTIRIQVALPLSPPLRVDLDAFSAGTSGPRNYPDWSIYQTNAESGKGWRTTSLRLAHQATGLRAWVQAGRITTIEASLSNILSGCNGQLIRDQRQLDQARHRLWSLLETITIPGSRKGQLSRLDLVLHLPIAPARMLPVLRYARSPNIRRETLAFNTTSVVFPGALIRITGYDKAAQMKLGPGHLTRLEVSLKKSKVVRQHLDHRDFSQLNFQECYQVYRKLVLAFDLPPEPTTGYSEPGLIAACEDQSFRPTGIAVADWALQAKKHPRTRRRLQREIAKNLCGLRRIDLGALLPEDGPLPACLEPVLF